MKIHQLVIYVLSAALLAAQSGVVTFSSIDAYWYRGFDQRYTVEPPVRSNAVMVIPTGKTNRTYWPVYDILPEIVKRPVFSVLPPDQRDCTVVLPFTVSDAVLERYRSPLGLLIPQIGLNYEVYMNGHMLHRAMYTNAQGKIVRGAMRRGLVLYLPREYLRQGTNILAMYLSGDAQFMDTAVQIDNQFRIDHYRELLAERQNPLSLILIALYLFIGFYHLFLFANRVKGSYNIFYGFFSIALFVYLFCRTPFIYTFIPDSNIHLLVEVISLYALFPLIGLFFDHVINRKAGLFSLIYSGFVALLTLATILAPSQSFRIDVLRVWQYTALIPLIYFIVFLIGRAFLRDIQTIRKSGRTLSVSVADALFREIPGNLLIGTILVSLSAVFDIVDSIAIHANLMLSNYFFFFFVAGITFVLTNRFLKVQQNIESLNADLEKKVVDLNSANAAIGMSERINRMVLENTNDIIITLDPAFTIMSANQALSAVLRHNPKRCVGKPLSGILYAHDEKDRVLLKDTFDRFITGNEPLEINLEFLTAFTNEPKPMQVRFTHIDSEGSRHVLMKASTVDDRLFSYLETEEAVYRIDNQFGLAEDISRRLAHTLIKYLPADTVAEVRIALREILLNAIEHGNLAVGFEEKSAAQLEDRYFDFIRERQSQEPYSKRRVEIRYVLRKDRAIFRIRDEGGGFDWRARANGTGDAAAAGGEMLAHGRGIVMTRKIFSEMRYNEAGNEVTLSMIFRKDA
ncbi:MAG: ATP-binding protein [Spirochaetes bacterium]|nr:ATP-binding protein [Spirochaetota bacterium]